MSQICCCPYGEGIEEGEAALLAPGPGQSLERYFSPTGVLTDARLSDTPSPGVPPMPAATADTETRESRGEPTAFGSLGGLAPVWAVLAGLAGELFIAAAVARTASMLRKRDVEA
ncbi:MAG: hypothetical protein EXR68_02915 [Dehalococcoidia bacterium]|nr:hypothetical protein [Dehalococcoidia bacterium]